VAEETGYAASHLQVVSEQEPHLLIAERLAAEIRRMKHLRDSDAQQYLEEALRNVKNSALGEWYRYGL
jgi:hypothetical protein